MPKENDLKQLLATAAAAGRKSVTEVELNKAAQELAKKARVTREEVDLISESITRDKQTFAVVDIDDINDILARGSD